MASSVDILGLNNDIFPGYFGIMPENEAHLGKEPLSTFRTLSVNIIQFIFIHI